MTSKCAETLINKGFIGLLVQDLADVLKAPSALLLLSGIGLNSTFFKTLYSIFALHHRNLRKIYHYFVYANTVMTQIFIKVTIYFLEEFTYS